MFNKKNKMHIVLASNYNFSEQLITTIKSICYHNKNIQFYLLNKDFPSEWFHKLNLKLEKINSHVIDLKIFNDDVDKYYTYTGSSATYFRYFIPDLIPENKVLYLDCDLVVTGALDCLFLQSFDDCFVIAATDILAMYIHKVYNFNAGVMLINNALWKQEGISKKAIDISNNFLNQFPDGDQSVLNYLFENKWKEVSNYYNYLTGSELIFNREHAINYLEEMNKNIVNLVPLIIHYNTSEKPWKENTDKIKYKKVYWFYRNLDWTEIYLNQGFSI